MKRTRVLLFGTFDVIHAGHRAFFKQARRLGEYIIAILARDRTVRSIKGRQPLNSEKVRMRALKKTGWADKIILGSLGDKYSALKTIKPDIICLGYDQTAFVKQLAKKIISFKLKTRIIRLKPFKPNLYKSSIIQHYAGHQIHTRKRGKN